MNNLRDLITYCLKKWYWFATAIVLCMIVGVLYYFSTTMRFETSLTYHPRENEQGRMFSNLGSLAEQTMMGVGNYVRVTDEQEKLNSHAVMRATVRELGLQTECRKKVHMRWIGQYPQADFGVQFLELDNIAELPHTVKIDIKKTNAGYSIKVKSVWKTSKHKVATLDEPIETVAGTLRLFETGEEVSNGKYRLVVRTLAGATDMFCASILSDRVADDNHILCISARTDMPKRTEAVMCGMVRNYNRMVTADKHKVAQEVDKFLDIRINATCQEIAELKNSKTLSKDEKDYRIAGKEEGLKMLMQRKEENAFAMVYALELLNVIDPVYTKAQPVAPKGRNVLILSFILGFILTIIALYLKDALCQKGK